ncbi:P-loop containing nucleoside triphosphate hydrolase protein [Cadophora sp. MPI-SDFR-AT-0126]|nr:P-loop containing nucleoside triphosphate hydrolase protein [Leotiomycetes sp. MPI-SDFR-AT-0126]
MENKLFVQMSGAPGAGKSTIANLLAVSIQADVVDHDLIKSQILDDGMPFNETSKRTYALQWTAAESIMKRGKSVIVDSTCNFRETLDTGAALAERYGYLYKYVECSVDDIDLLDKRLHQRVPMRSQRRGVDEPALDAPPPSQGCRAQYQHWMQNPFRPATGAIIVDSSQSPHECVENILKCIIHDGTENAKAALA